MFTRNALVAIVLGVFGLACGHSLEYTATNRSPRPLSPRDPASVEVYATTLPTRPHVEVGLFEIEQRTPASGGTPEMIGKLRERAARVGCDALVVSEARERIQSVTTHHHGTVHQHGPHYGTMHSTGTGTVNVVRKHTAACVVFTEDAAVRTTQTSAGEVAL
jgi:hypothetical protein